MEERTCPGCGRPLDAVDAEFALLDPHSEHLPHASAVTVPPMRRVTVMAGALVVVAALLGAVSLMAGGGEETAPAEVAAPLPTRPAGAAAGVDLDLDQRTIAQQVAARFDEVLGDRRIAYAGTDGVVVIGGGGLAAAPVEISPRAHTLEVLGDLQSYALLSSGSSTFAIGPGVDDGVFLLSNVGPVVRTRHAFSIGVDASRNTDEVIVSTAGGLWVDRVQLPPGSATLNVPDLGVLVMPPSGGTYLAEPGSLVPFATGRVVAATGTHHVELHCDEPLSCRPVLVNRAAGDRSVVPDAFAGDTGTVTISPDGRRLLLSATRAGKLLDVDTGAVTAVDALGSGAVSWSPGSDVVVWFQAAGQDVVLAALDPETGVVERIDLGGLGAGPRVTDGVVVY